MKTIHSITITLAALIGRNREGNSKLLPVGHVLLVVQDPVGTVEGVEVRVTSEELREYADALSKAADELDKTVGPMLENATQLTQEQALDQTRLVVALEQDLTGLPDFSEEQSAKLTEINAHTMVLIRNGWNVDFLKKQLLEAGKKADHADGCGCQEKAPDLGNEPIPFSRGGNGGEAGEKGTGPTEGTGSLEGRIGGAGGGEVQEQVEQEQQEGTEDQESYEYVKAVRDAEGNLTMRYKVKGADREGSQSGDEDISDWDDADVIDLVARLLDIPEDQRSVIELQHE